MVTLSSNAYKILLRSCDARCRAKIRTKKIDREEGVALVNKYDSELPEEFVGDYLDYMDMSEDQFLSALDSFQNQASGIIITVFGLKSFR